MKKYVLLIVLLVFSFASFDTFATDSCERIVLQEANFIWKAKFASNLRSLPCIATSTVYGASKPGALYRVIAKVDARYKIRMDDGTIYWIREESIERTNNTVTNPEPVKEEYVEPVYEEPVKTTWYQLTLADKRMINKFVYKMSKIINERWEEYKELLVSALWELIDEYWHVPRLVALFQDAIKKLNAIEKQEENVVVNNYVNTNTSVNTYNLNNTHWKESSWGIDISRVKNVWMWRYNWVRKDLWRNAYVYNSKLESTALDWSKTSKARWYMDHKRNSADSYYDYNKITSWFKDRGVVCKNIYGVTHTENIWYGSFSCNDGECTDELIKWIRSTFDFFYNEKYKSYQAHYLSMVNKYFTQIWLWIELEDKWNGYYKYYLTVHYCTEVQ